ncbi:hypothetical protein DFQ26_001957 [Actinomortierella ambigua]|nr:hypothetical protein DFQ26_001957 [Actinomortierella ambigua]
MEDPINSHYSSKTKTAVWIRCTEFVMESVQAKVQNDPSLAEKAKKELDKIESAANKEKDKEKEKDMDKDKDKKRYENAAAEWARLRVRHLAAIVKKTHFYVYERMGQGTLDGADLDEQAERLCPHFAELRDLFDKTATLKVRHQLVSTWEEESQDSVALATADFDEEVSRVESEGEEGVEKHDGPSVKRQKLADKGIQIIDSAMRDIKALIANQRPNDSAQLRDYCMLMMERGKEDRMRFQEEKASLIAQYETRMKNLEVGHTKHTTALLDAFFSANRGLESKVATLESKLEEERATFESRLEAERKARDALIERLLPAAK